jgi:hypothetical protein
MINRKDIEGYGHVLIVILSVHLHRGTEEIQEKPQSG